MSNKILIIEDEPDIRKTIEYNLSREGFKILTAASLKEGKELQHVLVQLVIII